MILRTIYASTRPSLLKPIKPRIHLSGTKSSRQTPQASLRTTKSMPGSAADHPVLARLLSSNAQWSRDVISVEPQFFELSAKGQAPKVLWIGCADSRVPESVLLACKPGEIFVHRNIANQFHLDDDSALSVLTYAIDYLGVEHVIVVGHTKCGGAAAGFHGAQQLKGIDGALAARTTSLERWLAPLTEMIASLDVCSKPESEAVPLIVEANVAVQVANIVQTNTIANAWAGGKPVHVHGWVYLVEEGRLKDLQISKGPGSQ